MPSGCKIPLASLAFSCQYNASGSFPTELCQNYGYYLITDKKILDLGDQGVTAMQKTPSGYVQQHPLLSLRRQYYELWRKGLLDFGLTPASRVRMGTEDEDTSIRTNDPMERLLNKKW